MNNNDRINENTNKSVGRTRIFFIARGISRKKKKLFYAELMPPNAQMSSISQHSRAYVCDFCTRHFTRQLAFYCTKNSALKNNLYKTRQLAFTPGNYLCKLLSISLQQHITHNHPAHDNATNTRGFATNQHNCVIPHILYS